MTVLLTRNTIVTALALLLAAVAGAYRIRMWANESFPCNRP